MFSYNINKVPPSATRIKKFRNEIPTCHFIFHKGLHVHFSLQRSPKYSHYSKKDEQKMLFKKQAVFLKYYNTEMILPCLSTAYCIFQAHWLYHTREETRTLAKGTHHRPHTVMATGVPTSFQLLFLLSREKDK